MKSIMGIICSKVNYKELVIPESKERVVWYPILKWNKSELFMGVKSDGTWVVEGKSDLYILSETSSFWRLVSLMEQPLGEVRGNLVEFFNSLEIQIDIDNIFPFVEIVRAGFEFGTKHWAELAFKWYDELLLDKKKCLKDSLVKLKTTKWASQELRHKAMKELRRMGC